MTTVEYLFAARLGFDPRGASTVDWLAAPTQMLRAMIGGAVFEDGPGDMVAARDALAWYPHAVWLYVLGCQWRRIAQEEAFVGRCTQVGDELGAAVIGRVSRRDFMRLGFLLEREYPPYSKWLGTAFAQLDCASELLPHMRERRCGRLILGIACNTWRTSRRPSRDGSECTRGDRASRTDRSPVLSPPVPRTGQRPLRGRRA